MSGFRRKADVLIEEHPDLFDDERVRPRERKRKGRRKSSTKRVARSKSGGGVPRWIAWLGMAVVLVPMAGMGGAGGALLAWLHHAPPISEFADYDPPEATVIHDRAGRAAAVLYEQQRFVVPLGEMSTELASAFIAIEDERFFHHVGVDPLGIARAMTINLARGRMSQGASTITQQTARNLLPRIGSEKTIHRKFREMLASFQLEHEFSKDQILEVYLNQIYLGSGTYGVEAASRKYFGKGASRLNLVECASLAGLPQLPERYSPLNNPSLTVKRRNHVLMRMYELGYIDSGEFDKAIVSDLRLVPQRLARSSAPYFLDAVRRKLADDERLDGAALQTAGWDVYTTLDPQTQEIAERVLREGLDREEAEWLALRQQRYEKSLAEPESARAPAPEQIRMGRVVRVYTKSCVVELPGGWRADIEIPQGSAAYFEGLNPGDGVDLAITEVDYTKSFFEGRLLPETRLQGALVCLDAATGEVRALAGGREYGDVANNGFFNRAILARRQAGSTMKPFFFAAGLEAGLTPWTTFHDRRISFSDGYTPRNFENRHFGITSIQTAFEHSRNVPTIMMVQETGLRRSLQFVAGFNRVSPGDWVLPQEWPVVLGTTGVTPLELAAAYQPFANGGLARGPRIIKTIQYHERRGAISIEPPEPHQLLGSQTSAYMVQMMAGVMGHGTGKSLRGQLPESLRDRVAGKSGTTNDNRDAWFAGFTPHEVVVAWVGFDQNLPLGPGRTGSKAAGPIWADFLTEVWRRKTPDEQAASLHLPPGYAMAAVDPRDSHVLHPGDPGWIEPPHWRVFSRENLKLEGAFRQLSQMSPRE